MKRLGWLVVLPLLLAAKGASNDPEALLRAGDSAFDANEPGRAAELYDRASLRTTDPVRVAFNLATARYRQSRENLTALADAEVNYRACLQSDEYRARAQFGLGNCLLIRATTGASLDRALLRAAIDRFSACLADDRCEEALRDDARYNREKARLLLLQAPPSPQGKNDEPPGDESKEKDDSPPSKGKDKSQANGGELTPTPNGSTDKGIERPPEGKKDGQQTPGKGTLIQPPDDKDAPPLPKDDAALHVERAARRILEDLAAHRRGKARPMGAGGKDW